MQKQTEFIARGFIFQNEKVLLCKRKDRDYYFFPGGHVEFGEYTEEALKREIKEEIDTNVTSCNFIGISENIFEDLFEKKIHHELNIFFETKIQSEDVHAMEDYLEFNWLNVEDFLVASIKPVSQKNAIIQWMKDKKMFWVKQKDLK
jgi:8-oxo-dGTP diphosphatase